MDTSTPPESDDRDGESAEVLSSLPEHFKSYIEYLKKIPALTSDQQVALLENTRDPSPAIRREARNRLWLDSLKFVIFVRMKMRSSLPFVRLDDMDMIQEGNLAAGLALERWDPEKGALSTWLYPHVRGAFLNYAGKETKAEQTAISLDAPVTPESRAEVIEHMQGADLEEPPKLGELLTYDAHVFEDPEIVTEYGQVRKHLVQTHGANGWGDLAADFLIGETNVRELATKYGVTVPTVYNRMRKMGF